MRKDEIISMKYDFMFKSVLLNKEARGYLISILNLITKIPKEELNNLTLKNTEHLKNGKSEKKKQSDIIVEIENNTICIEMNKDYRPGLYDRNFSYASKIRDYNIKEKESYKDYKYVILINFDNFNRYKDDRSIIKFEMLDKVRLVEEGVRYESYHIILPNINEKYYNEDSLNKLEKLLEVINLESIEELEKYSKEDKEIRKVVNLIMELSREEELQGWYDKEKERRMLDKGYYEELREEALKEGHVQGKREGIEQGKKEGIKEGIEQGSRENTIHIVKNMLDESMDINLISKLTGLTIEEISKIKK